MPAIAISTVTPEIKHRLPGGRGRALQRLVPPVAGRALLALALEIEERVVDADRHAHQQDHRAGRIRGVDRRGSRPPPARPSRARPRTRAAPGSRPRRTAPNAISRIRNVIGSDSCSAFCEVRCRSSCSARAFALASPNSATVKPGSRAAAPATASSTGCTRLVGGVGLAPHVELDQLPHARPRRPDRQRP